MGSNFMGRVLMNKLIILIVACCFVLAGCATYTPMGVILTETTIGQSANNHVKPFKTGKSCVVSVFGLFARGKSGINEAKINGNIHHVASVDYEVFNVLGVYGKYCTVVKGE